MKRRLLTIGFVVTAFSVGGHATQAPSSGAHFETVVIKAADGVQSGGGTRTLPDGTTIMTGARIRQFILLASPVPVRSVAGAPDWVDRQRYDITLKPPAGSSREQRAEMMHNLFVERMKLAGHIEDQEQTTFALIINTPDKSLGPNLKPTTRNCPLPDSRPPAGGFDRCGQRVGPGTIDGEGVLMDVFARSISGFVGGQVTDRTGLSGRYDISLRFAPIQSPPNAPGATDALPFAQALQQQLGLTLYPEKTKVPVFVIDHLEQPTVDQ